MAKIANPIYDTVFKYLMEDERCAKVLLGALLNCKITEITMKQTEVSQKIKDQLEIYRLDFSAKILDDNGKENAVTIELQKAKLESDVVRFRKYLASQYTSESNIRKEGRRNIAIPIISIYILGYKCCDIQEPVIYGNPHFFNANNKEIKKLESNLIFGLIHRMIIVQVPYLKANAQTRVEKYLSIFDQNNRIDKTTQNAHTLSIETSDTDQHFDCLVRRLESAHADELVQHAMDVEDEIYDEFLRLGEENDELRTTLKSKIEELLNLQKLITEKDSQIAKQKEQISTLINILSSVKSPDEIATALGITPNEVKSMLNKE